MPITTGFHSIWRCPFFVRSPLITLIIFFVKSTHGTVQYWPEVTTEMSPFLGWKLPQEQPGDSLCRWTLLPSQMLWKCWWINTIKPQTNVVVHHSSVRTKVFLQCATGAVFNQQQSAGIAQRTIKPQGKNLKISQLGALFITNGTVDPSFPRSIECSHFLWFGGQLVPWWHNLHKVPYVWLELQQQLVDLWSPQWSCCTGYSLLNGLHWDSQCAKNCDCWT